MPTLSPLSPPAVLDESACAICGSEMCEGSHAAPVVPSDVESAEECACEIRRIGAALVWFARDKAALLANVTPAEDFVVRNLRSWIEWSDRPVILEIGRDQNDTYRFAPSRLAPDWWNAAARAWDIPTRRS